MSLGLFYGKHIEPILNCYSDVDFASDHLTRKSVSGVV